MFVGLIGMLHHLLVTIRIRRGQVCDDPRVRYCVVCFVLRDVALCAPVLGGVRVLLRDSFPIRNSLTSESNSKR